MAGSLPGSACDRDVRARWPRFLRGEYSSETLRSVPSWGMSVLLHALLLLILAFLIQIRRGAAHSEAAIGSATVDTQLGELTSLVEANRSGDPFTLKDTPDPPSLGLETADRDLKLVGQPEIPTLA